MKWLRTGLGIGLVVGTLGCASRATLVGPRPPSSVTLGEERSAGACGFLLFGVLPLGVNSRTERAYAGALEAGDQGLTDTELRYSWWLIPGGVLLCSVVRGTA